MISSESEYDPDKEEISPKIASSVEIKSEGGEDLENIEIDEPDQETGTSQVLRGLASTFDPHKDESYSFQAPQFLPISGMMPETGGQQSSFQLVGQQLKVAPTRPSYENFSDSEGSGDFQLLR